VNRIKAVKDFYLDFTVYGVLVRRRGSIQEPASWLAA
jgi:hypothetical protein